MIVVRTINTFDRVELLAAVAGAPAGARGGVLELRDDGVAMLEITSPELNPAERVVFAPVAALRRVG